MKSSLGFTLNGVHSDSLGVYNVGESRSLYNEQVTAPFQTHATTLNSGMVVSVKKEYQNLEIPMTIYFSLSKDVQLRHIIKWLTQEEFVELTFDEFPNKVLLVKTKQLGQIQHNGLGEGLISVTFLAEQPYFLSTEIKTDIYEMQRFINIILHNDGDKEIYPKIWIEKKGKGKITIENKTSGKNFELDNLLDGEKIFINGDKRLIHSSQETLGVYRGKDHNRVWFSLVEDMNYGVNEIKIKGGCRIQFAFRYKYLTIL